MFERFNLIISLHGIDRPHFFAIPNPEEIVCVCDCNFIWPFSLSTTKWIRSTIIILLLSFKYYMLIKTDGIMLANEVFCFICKIHDYQMENDNGLNCGELKQHQAWDDLIQQKKSWFWMCIKTNGLTTFSPLNYFVDVIWISLVLWIRNVRSTGSFCLVFF